MKSILRSTILISFLFLFINSCSKDGPVPDAVVPTPTLTFTLAVTASEGGSVDISGGTYNENSNVTVTAAPAEGYVFSGWTGNASGSTNPLTVSMTGNKDITATFSRNQYALTVGVVGQGSVDQELVSSAKSKTDYDSGSTVRLTATPSSGSIFNSWSGSSTETTNQIDITINGTKSVIATFEEQLTQLSTAGVFNGLGRWVFRTTDSSSNRSAGCELSEIIFRTDDSFTIITSISTITGQFNVESNGIINLTQSESPFGTITNLVLTNSFISFSISLNSGCTEDVGGDKDDDYNEATDTTLPPVIYLIGSSTMYLQVGDIFTDPGATATDNVDGDLTSSITSSGTVDTTTTGTYTIEYSVSDAEGNSVLTERIVVIRSESTDGYTFSPIILTNPPFYGTNFITGNIITSTDPSLFSEIEYIGTGSREMYDRRNGGAWINIEPYLFYTSFSDGLKTEIQINPEFTLDEATVEANKYAFLIGQLPTALRKDVQTMWIHKGEEAYGGGNYNLLVHTGMTENYENYDTGVVEETLIHEAAHTSLDAYHYPQRLTNGEGWIEAVNKDGGCYISDYARDYPYRENIAELMPLYVAVKFFPERISNEIRDKILSCSLNRILYLDSLNLDMSLYEN